MAEGEDKDGGYDCDLVEEPPDDLICPICLLPSRKPHLISCCGTKLCHSCVDRVKQAGQPCPCCRGEGYDIVIDRKVERQVLDLKVYCKNKSKGCHWSGELRDLEKHTESCHVTSAELLAEKNEIIKKQAEKITKLEIKLLAFRDKKEDELIAAQNTIKQLKEENETLQTEKVESETLLRTHCSQLEESQRKLEEEKEALIGRSEYYEAEAERNQQTIEVMKVQVSSLESSFSEFSKELDKEERKRAVLQRKLKRELEQFQLMHGRKIAEKNKVVEHDQIETLEEENRKLHDKVGGLTHQETVMKRSIETLNVENEQLKKQLREIKRSLPKFTPPTAPPPRQQQPQNGLRHCPVCQLAFPARTSQQVFEQHVNSHLGNPR